MRDVARVLGGMCALLSFACSVSEQQAAPRETMAQATASKATSSTAAKDEEAAPSVAGDVAPLAPPPVPPPAAVAPSPTAGPPAGRTQSAAANKGHAAGAGAMAQRERRAAPAKVSARADKSVLAPSPVAVAPTAAPNTESYSNIVDNAFVAAKSSPLSTFSIDVDTASYSNVRRFLEQGQKPPPDAVRIEELINYFTYDYSEPQGDMPFSVKTELSNAPWNPAHKLLLVGLQGRHVNNAALPARNLVFLVDVSGSMGEPNKLPLLKYALRELVQNLNARDHVSLVVYAGASGVVLDPTPANEKSKILEALDRLEAGGGTNGAGGIEAAYALAERSFDARGVNRVVLATDGDFNLGVTSEGDLVRLIENKRQKGVSLSVLGFGMGNYKDATLEKLADHGNGNYAYIDTRSEARKVLVEQGAGTLVTIAKDVKIQVEWNPRQVGAYRLIGYENRALAAQDFNDDKKDAGDIGAGHSVTALYEITPVDDKATAGSVDPLKYQRTEPSAAGASAELATIKLRFKRPRHDQSELVAFPVSSDARALSQTSNDFRFASAVAGFGMLLRNSEHRGATNLQLVEGLARDAQGSDPSHYRADFLRLVSRAKSLN